MTIIEAEELIKLDYLEKIDGMAQLDIFRQARTGIPEVIFAQTKTPDQILKITINLLKKNQYAILTRITENQFIHLRKEFENNQLYRYQENLAGKTAVIFNINFKIPQKEGKIGIITAGSSDIPVAEEARIVFAIGFHSII